MFVVIVYFCFMRRNAKKMFIFSEIISCVNCKKRVMDVGCVRFVFPTARVRVCSSWRRLNFVLFSLSCCETIFRSNGKFYSHSENFCILKALVPFQVNPFLSLGAVFCSCSFSGTIRFADFVSFCFLCHFSVDTISSLVSLFRFLLKSHCRAHVCFCCEYDSANSSFHTRNKGRDV